MASVKDSSAASATSSGDVFRSFHRGRLLASLRVRVPLVIVVGAMIAAGVAVSASATPTAGIDTAAGGALIAAPSAPLADGAAAADTATAPSPEAPALVLPAEGSTSDATVASVAAEATTPVAPTPLYSIAVTARGHQAELDACQWVRMDVGAIAPIVGAHNFCHGDEVLALAVGDVVTVTGTDLDGDYQVTGSRDARAGDNGASATAGLVGDIIFQTCYWDDARAFGSSQRSRSISRCPRS
jgi:hypothetical protein